MTKRLMTLLGPKNNGWPSKDAPLNDSMTTFGLLRSEPGSKKLTPDSLTSNTVTDEATLMLPASNMRSKGVALVCHPLNFSTAFSS